MGGGLTGSRVLASAGMDRHRVEEACGLRDLDRVPLRPAPWWLRRLWTGPIDATTLPWAVYVRPELLDGDPVRLARLVVHELVHVRQWEELGWVRFLWRYLGEYLSGRRRGLSHRAAYHAISLEREAREVARLA